MPKQHQTSSLFIKLLLALNLVAILVFGYWQYQQSKKQENTLPDNIQLAVLDYFAAKFIHDYNQQDLDALFYQFSSTAQKSLQRSHVDTEFKHLFSDFKYLSKQQFSSLEYISKHEDKKVYKAMYETNCELDNGNKKTCLLIFTLGLNNSFPEIFGITLTEKK